MTVSTSTHFISGLPRSGSTLLANLLAQNPRFHSTATSGILNGMRYQFRFAPTDLVQNMGRS